MTTSAQSVVGIISFLHIRSTRIALTTRVSDELTGLASSEASIIGSVLANRVESVQAFGLDADLLAAVAAQNTAYNGGTEAILAELADLDAQCTGASHPRVRNAG